MRGFRSGQGSALDSYGVPGQNLRTHDREERNIDAESRDVYLRRPDPGRRRNGTLRVLRQPSHGLEGADGGATDGERIRILIPFGSLTGTPKCLYLQGFDGVSPGRYVGGDHRSGEVDGRRA